MRTPAFWSARGVLSSLLVPVGILYEMLSILRRACIREKRVGVPVICVGGLTSGGAGKTPLALHIGEYYKEKGVNAWFLSRGYKGKLQGPIQVKPTAHTSHEVGDEPLLLARVLPTIVAKKRLHGAQFAAKQGAQVIIMDDGFQNPYIHKTCPIAVIDGKRGFGNGRLVPAGPLRETPEHGLARAKAIVVINPSEHTPPLPANKITLAASTQADDSAHGLSGKKIVAFCGLAYPQKFFETLKNVGAEIISERSFPDHYQYKESEIDALATHAKQQDALLVTTSKDAARMSSRSRSLVTVVKVSLVFDDPKKLAALLDEALASHDA